MHTNGKLNKFVHNIKVAFVAQGFSLATSVIISFFVPKILGVDQFGYWQLFLFYSSFSGVFIFGVLEGIYLSYGGVNYENLEFEKLSSQFWAVAMLQIIFAGVLILFASLFVKDYNRLFIFICLSCSILLTNVNSFFGYIFQASNETQLYSISIIINKTAFLVLIAILLLGRDGDYRHYILLYLLSIIFSIIFSGRKGKRIYQPPFLKLPDTFQCLAHNVSIGFSLLLSNLASMLIIGMSRFIIDSLWGIKTFGKISLSISLANFFLLFIAQISMVLFPALKQTNKENQRKLYNFGNDTLSIMLTGIFILYLPIKYLLGLWLPQYKESLEYLAVLLPICTFDGKMQMLCSTYMKVLRKERVLLLFNVVSLVISACFCLFSGFILHSVQAILISMVAAITIRSILSDLYVSRIIGVIVAENIIGDVALAAWFIFCTYAFTPIVGFILYFISYLFYLYLNKNKIQSLKATARDLFRAPNVSKFPYNII